MKAVLQRVTRASVEVDATTVGRIDIGLLVLLGVAKEDDERDALYLAEKISSLRIFADEQGKMNRSIADIKGAVLLVSQFTLLGETAKGRRPDFVEAAAPEQAKILYERVAEALRSKGLMVETGRFGAYMKVELVNDGPVTLLLDSRRAIRREMLKSD
ncbi:MAG TPA: D-aminoacyl-tRNA deacylase [Nitrospiraceae bacterium]|nr:D-aminoacyl-tRNA deacylase [Nitrospiraceae bacterium]